MASIEDDIKNTMSIAEAIIRRHKRNKEATTIMKDEFDHVINSNDEYQLEQPEPEPESEDDDQILQQLSNESAKLIDELQKKPEERKRKRLITVLNKLIKLEYMDKEAKKEILETLKIKTA